MAKSGHIALSADPDDADDFDVSEEGLTAALGGRSARRAVGRPRGSNRQQIALRIDKDDLARWKAGGPGWQSRMIGTLRQVSGSGFIIADAMRGQGAGARVDRIAT